MSNFVDAVSKGSRSLIIDNLQEIASLEDDQKFLFYHDGKIGRERDAMWRSVRSYVMPWAQTYIAPYAKSYITIEAPNFSDQIDNLRVYTEVLFRHFKNRTYPPHMVNTIEKTINTAMDKLCQLVGRYHEQKKRHNVLIVEASVLKLKSCITVMKDRTTLKYNKPVEVYLSQVIFDICGQYGTKKDRLKALLNELDDEQDMERILTSGDEKLKLIRDFFESATVIPAEYKKPCLCEILLGCYSLLHYGNKDDSPYVLGLKTATRQLSEMAARQFPSLPQHQKQALEKGIIAKYQICTLAWQ